MKRYWWVNHKQTFAQEVGGGYLWSPKKNKNGSNNETYNNMTKAQLGDEVFSFAGGKVMAVGRVQGPVEEAPKPEEFGLAGQNWGGIGWYLPVTFVRLESPMATQAVASSLAKLLPEKYAPIRADGKGNQGVYLAAIPDAMAARLRQLLEGQMESAEQKIGGDSDSEAAEESAERKLAQRTDIGATQIAQLIKARRGQGVFRSNLLQIEKKCRVTGVTDPVHLRASHIKAWKDSNDFEKLDGNNGLLLAPHVDHLFDRHYIGFADDGRMIVSKYLPESVLEKWCIDPRKYYGPFSESQKRYLTQHRQLVLN